MVDEEAKYLYTSSIKSTSQWKEAGIIGQADSQPFGPYQYGKWGSVCQVTVFLLHVQTVHEEWPKQMYRRWWMSISEAAKLVEESGLSDLILRASTLIEETMSDQQEQQ